MKLTQLTFSWLVLTLIGFGTYGAVISSYVPTAQTGFDAPVADNLVFGALYSGFFLFVLGATALAGYAIRYRRYQTIYPTHHTPVVRQASLIALAATCLLILAGSGVLTWWDGVLLIFALILIELSFQVRTPSVAERSSHAN